LVYVSDDAVERERRQLTLMLDRLGRFEEGSASIGTTISDLKALLWELSHVTQSWRDAFLEAWGHLEVPYAVALSHDAPIPTIADPEVAGGVAQLRLLVQESLDRLQKAT
jgi:hypothetical protein